MRVGLAAPGHMGAGLGAVLVRHGASVIVPLAGRSAASLGRAERAGLTAAPDESAFGEVDVVLSVVPPGQALATAERIAPHIGTSSRRPLFIEANAISPARVRAIQAVVEASGGRVCDGGIIGLPPGTASRDPTLYVSGPDTEAAERLSGYGLTVQRLDDRIGSASSLKMSYAGITKGLIALASAMILNASANGVAGALRQELEASQAQLLAGFRRGIPDMVGKAGRWVAEMEEIAAFCRDDGPEGQAYDAFAALYNELASDAGQPHLKVLSHFFEP